MGIDPKKTALRMIPYGLYILTAKAKDGTVAAARTSEPAEPDELGQEQVGSSGFENRRQAIHSASRSQPSRS